MAYGRSFVLSLALVSLAVGRRAHHDVALGSAALDTVSSNVTSKLDFLCPHECSSCCQAPKIFGIGTSSSSFKCILKDKSKQVGTVIPANRRYSCSKPVPRSKSKHQFKTECKFPEDELLILIVLHGSVENIVPKCGRLAECCCPDAEKEKKGMKCVGLPEDANIEEGFPEVASDAGGDYVLMPMAEQGVTTCVEWEWDEKIVFHSSVMNLGTRLAKASRKKPGYRCKKCKASYACGGEEIIDCEEAPMYGWLQAQAYFGSLWYASFVRQDEEPYFGKMPLWEPTEGPKLKYKRVAVGHCASEKKLKPDDIQLTKKGECPTGHFAEADYCLCDNTC